MEKWWLLPLVPPILGTILAFSFPIAIGVILTSLMMAPAILVIVYFVFRFSCVRALGRPSIDPGFTKIIRYIQKVLPISALRSGSIVAREFLMQTISQESQELKFDKSPFQEDTQLKDKGFRIESISYPGRNEDGEEVSFIFFHGGALSICDSADLLLCQRLLPLISHFCNDAEVKMYSVLYTTKLHSEKRDKGTWATVQREIFEGYSMVEKAVKGKNPNGKLAAIVGDSAGGYLSLCLGLQLVHLNHAHVPSLALISPWLNCFTGDRYSTLTSQAQYQDDILHDTFIQSSLTNYWADVNQLDESTFELRTQRDLCLPAHSVNPWLSTRESISKLPSILCLAGSNEVLIEEIREFWDKFIAVNTDSSATRTPGRANPENARNAKVKVKAVKFTGKSDSAAAGANGESDGDHGSDITVVTQSLQSPELIQLGASGATRELVIGDAEIHAYPLFWRHPLRRILAPLGLTSLFEVIYPPKGRMVATLGQRITAQPTPSTPGTPGTPSSPGSEVGGLTWREVATPAKASFAEPSSGKGQLVGLIPSISEDSIDSYSADAAIVRVARFIAAEHSAR